MWDNIGFAFRLVATCVRLVASDRRVAECGTILVLRFVSSLQIVESPNRFRPHAFRIVTA